jgi:hypothetical protein
MSWNDAVGTRRASRRGAGFQTCRVAALPSRQGVERAKRVEDLTRRRFGNLRHSRFGNLRYDRGQVGWRFQPVHGVSVKPPNGVSCERDGNLGIHRAPWVGLEARPALNCIVPAKPERLGRNRFGTWPLAESSSQCSCFPQELVGASSPRRKECLINVCWPSAPRSRRARWRCRP